MAKIGLVQNGFEFSSELKETARRMKVFSVEVSPDEDIIRS
jgi:hypothetical protein